MRRFLLCLVAVQYLLAVAGSAQDKRTVYAGCGKYPFMGFSDTGDFAHSEDPITNHYLAMLALTRGSVPPTDGALRAALRDSAAKIRYSAAWYLADQNTKAAIPDIVVALEAERVPRAKAYIACALAELGDERGVQALHRYCDESDFPVAVKVDVANFLLELHQPSCPKAVVEGLAAGLLQAKVAVENFWEVSPSQYAELRALCLNDPDRGVKSGIINEIRTLRDIAAIPDLESAISREPDKLLQERMQNLLNELQGSKR